MSGGTVPVSKRVTVTSRVVPQRVVVDMCSYGKFAESGSYRCVQCGYIFKVGDRGSMAVISDSNNVRLCNPCAAELVAQ